MNEITLRQNQDKGAGFYFVFMNNLDETIVSRFSPEPRSSLRHKNVLLHPNTEPLTE